MHNQFNPQIEAILAVLVRHTLPNEQIYVVGGMVRGLFLNQPVHDIDIVFKGDIYRFGRLVADEMGFPFFVLNEQFHTVRVVVNNKDGERIHMDIVQMRGPGIQDDLKLRDLTVNAMALDLLNESTLVDPFNALADLKNKKLVLCSSSTFEDDPIRILRAIRQAIDFKFQMTNETATRLIEAVPLLSNVSQERIRDELVRLFMLGDVARAIHILYYTGVLAKVLPELCVGLNNSEDVNEPVFEWNSFFSSLKELSTIEKLLVSFESRDATNLHSSQLIVALGRFRVMLKEYFKLRLTVDRPLRALFFYVFLFLGVPSEIQFQQRSKALAFSNKEITFATRVIRNKDVIDQFVRQEKPLSGSQVYRFFQDAGPGGIMVCLFSLAQATTRKELDERSYLRLLEVVAVLFSAYFENPEKWVTPPQWLNGHDVGKILKTEDKAQTGFWLEQLKIASADDLIADRDAAIRFIEVHYRPIK